MRALALDPAAPKTTFDTTAAFELQSVVPLYLPQKLEVSTHLDAVSSRAPLVTRCALPHLVVSEGCSKRTVPCVEARAAAVQEMSIKSFMAKSFVCNVGQEDPLRQRMPALRETARQRSVQVFFSRLEE